jgi:hypothetical protein
MPGAPNRPPEADPLPPPPPVSGTPQQRILRRLAPMRVALHQDVWRGAPSPELIKPLDAAEASYAAGDLPHAESSLDQLAVRFAEPRWPNLPPPFRGLRQEIAPPVPPSWDPENALSPGEREARKLHRYAELQLKLAEASVAWANSHGVAAVDLAPHVEAARNWFASEGGSERFWSAIDPIWIALRDRVPIPGKPARPSTPQPTP